MQLVLIYLLQRDIRDEYDKYAIITLSVEIMFHCFLKYLSVLALVRRQTDPLDMIMFFLSFLTGYAY